ncbi:hypothetical protein D910_12782 [Dendroctonus ponderosae]|uniref:Sushi domain-containing protein n=1 Tax=Dendroctonus ponderosae TaxID=77166 RepID=U4UYW1_DENPD|nr:hypothetical protein D910_12782 [Dendroctonus ponderosae]
MFGVDPTCTLLRNRTCLKPADFQVGTPLILPGEEVEYHCLHGYSDRLQATGMFPCRCLGEWVPRLQPALEMEVSEA